MRRTILAPALALMVLGNLAACSSTNDTVGRQSAGGAGGGDIQIGPGVDCVNGPNFTDCPCSAGETKACYTGAAATRGVGACQDGVQTCAEHQELHFTFGACTGETLPSATNGGCVAESSSGTETGTGSGGGPATGCAAGECDPGIAAPRPIAPTSTGRVSAWRPTLRWELAPGTDGARVTLCHDRACTKVISILDATGASVKVSADLAPGVVYWKLVGAKAGVRGTVPGPVWEFLVGKVNTPVDTSWGSVFDVNGDGYADLFTANCGSVGNGQSSASLAVYHGGPTGIPMAPSQTIAGPLPVFELGWSLTDAGDVNGDGYADAIVGTWGWSTLKEGYADNSAHIYLGGPSGLAAAPWATLHGPLEGSQSWWDPAGNCPAAGSMGCDFFGGVVGPVGDIDGDGYADVAVAAQIPGPSGSSSNYVYVYRGGPTGFSAATQLGGPGGTLSLMENLYAYSGGITGADVNGDGYSDLVASGSVFMGGPTGLSTVPVVLTFGPSGPAAPTKGVATFTGDVDGDGYADVTLVLGSAYVFKGGPAGIATTPYLVTPVVWPKGGISPLWASAAIADVDGDGYADLAMGGNGTGPVSPSVQSLGFSLGSSAGPAKTPTLFTSTFVTPQSGPVIYSAGDLNGDGAEDLVIASVSANSQVQRMNVVYGTPAFGPAIVPTVVTLPDLNACGFAVNIGGAVGGI